MFSYLVKYTRSIIYSRGFHQDLPSYIDAEDIVQEVSLRAFRGFGRFEARNGAKITTWMYPIIARTAHLYQRDEKELDLKPYAIPSVAPEQLNRLLEEERDRAIHEMFGRINRKYRQILHGRLIEGWSIKRLSDQNHCSRYRMCRILKRARAELVRAAEEMVSIYGFL